MACFKYIIVGGWPRMGTKCEEHSVLLNLQFEKAEAGGFVEINWSSGLSPDRVHAAISEGTLQSRLKNEGDLIFSCYGEAVGLKVKSRGEVDAKLIKSCYR